MAFLNEKPDSKAIVELSNEVKQDMLRAFALGSTIQTIGKLYGLNDDEVTTFLNNRVDEIAAIKDFYSKVPQDIVLDTVTEIIVLDTVTEINERAVKENECKRN